TLNLPSGITLSGKPVIRPDVSGAVVLQGNAGDNLSGLSRVELSLDHRPWQMALLNEAAPNPLRASWQYTWTLTRDNSAQGTHTIGFRAVDRAGNRFISGERTVIVDRVPPKTEVASPAFVIEPFRPGPIGISTAVTVTAPAVRVGAPFTLYGRVNDAGFAPLPPRPQPLDGVVDAMNQATVWLGLANPPAGRG